MDKFVINGGKKLSGEVSIGGAKNAAVAIIPAVVLADEPCIIENLPKISDVGVILSILEYMGATVTRFNNDSSVEIDPRGISDYKVTCESLVQDMRASYYLLGALLGKFGKAEVPYPGGCKFCDRPINLHIKAFKALGATVNEESKTVVELSSEKLEGAFIDFEVASVGATMNAILAAVKTPGKTVINRAAKEPHVVDLANFLNSMGADIRGAGTDVIKIRGVERLRATSYSIIPDQIEAGTYMAAVAAAGGDVLIKDVIPQHLASITERLRNTGTIVEEYEDFVRVIRNEKLVACDVKTMPHPGFPTDMQPQFVALLSKAKGISKVAECVWEDRFSYIPQLQKMNADIIQNKNVAHIHGIDELEGADVEASDLRAGAALVIAGLSAKGTTKISNINYIERGYEQIVDKLTALGADIRRVTYVTQTTNKA